MVVEGELLRREVLEASKSVAFGTLLVLCIGEADGFLAYAEGTADAGCNATWHVVGEGESDHRKTTPEKVGGGCVTICHGIV